MSFGIYAAGKKEDVLANIKLYAGYGDTSQLEAVRELLLAEINAASDDKIFVVEASGHHDGSTRNLTINLRTYYDLRKV